MREAAFRWWGKVFVTVQPPPVMSGGDPQLPLLLLEVNLEGIESRSTISESSTPR